ncbi:MAG: Asp-tRNA(Asn)/Glu-tRNA(Gln) amidotransferase subunit GatA [Treponema sp.]|jgi:aspartyl-tRNA(Asn)/glutamyl-tRNA(Gln) amidotransferase subunit A|nr:Asp-tRNA(Asn)/Glu-tRNA(Gln) amidotransferase subunit GatA [Treponema sp.]
MFDLTALELSAAIKAGKYGVAEVTAAYIEKIEKTGKQLNAFTAVLKEQALARAKEVQALIDSGKGSNGSPLSPLAGVPIALKDNISTFGIETTCASKMLRGYKPVFNATAAERLEQAGVILIGKLNMDEFAMGSSSETGVFGVVVNPWDVSRTTGGSSGGSAAAVAAGLVPLTLGSDTGGSIRQPCSFCGITGIKPTYGAVSRHGLIACASSLDQIGPMTGNIDESAALLSIISGKDNFDGTCILEKPFEFTGEARSKINGVKIGLPCNYLKIVEEDIKTAILAAAKEFEAAGAVIEEFEMPLMDYAVPAYYTIACAEGSSNLSRFDGLKYGHRSTDAKTLSEVYRLSRAEGFGMEVKRRLMLGSFVLASENYDAYYKKAMQARTLIKDAYINLFKKYDIILSPVAPTTAFKLGEADPLKIYTGGIFNVPVNLAGLPAVSLPCGFDNQGLPIGLQLVGKTFSEAKLIEVAQVYQGCTKHHTIKPKGIVL